MQSVSAHLLYGLAAMMLCVAALSAAIGISLAGRKFLEGAARQPDVITKLRTQFLIVMGMIDVIPMITVAIALYFIFGLAAQ